MLVDRIVLFLVELISIWNLGFVLNCGRFLGVGKLIKVLMFLVIMVVNVVVGLEMNLKVILFNCVGVF